MPLLRVSAKILRRAVGAAVLVALLVVAGTATAIWWTARTDDRRRSDVIVVLGASQYDGRPSTVLRARLDHAKSLYDAGVAPLVMTAGGAAPGDRFTEAQAGEMYLSERKVTVAPVGEGRNTLQSLQAVKREMAKRGLRTAVVVTDPWHSLRSRQMARDLGIDAVTSPTRTGPSVHTRWTEVRYIARETAGLLYYRVLGGSSEAGPSAL